MAAAFDAAVSGADVRVVASGHRHCAAVVEAPGRRAVWAPSTRFVGDPADPPPGALDVDPAIGIVEHVFDDDGRHHHRVVRPWAAGPA